MVEKGLAPRKGTRMELNKLVEKWRADMDQAESESEVETAATLKACIQDLEHMIHRAAKPDRFNVIAFVDAETGGFDERENAILSVGVARVEPETLEVIQAHEVLIQPVGTNDRVITEQAARVNGYDPKRWAEEGVHPTDAIPMIANWLRGFPVWWGSHPSFDFRFIGELFRSNGARMPELWTHHLQDVGSFCWPLVEVGFAKGTSQTKLAEAFGLGTQAHGAKADVLQSLEIYRRARAIIRPDPDALALALRPTAG